MLVIYSDYQPLVSLLDRNFRWAGLSSYSVYLWHWPIAVFLIYSGQQHNGLWVMSAIALSFAAGWLSWVLIEQPGKHFLSQRSTRALWLILFACVGVAWLFSYLVKNDIVASQPDPLVNKIALEATNKNYAANPKTHLSTYGTGKPEPPDALCRTAAGDLRHQPTKQAGVLATICRCDCRNGLHPESIASGLPG